MEKKKIMEEWEGGREEEKEREREREEKRRKMEIGGIWSSRRVFVEYSILDSGFTLDSARCCWYYGSRASKKTAQVAQNQRQTSRMRRVPVFAVQLLHTSPSTLRVSTKSNVLRFQVFVLKLYTATNRLTSFIHPYIRLGLERLHVSMTVSLTKEGSTFP